MLENVKSNKIPFEANNAGFGMQSNNHPQGLPPMQGERIDPEKLKQNIQDSYVANRLGQLEDINPVQQLAVAAPVWYGLAQSMDVFAKKCRGASYTDSVQYRMGSLGDRISETFTESSIGKSSFTKWAGDTFSSAGKSIKKFLNKSAVFRAFDKTPSKPELKIVEGQANGIKGALMFDYPQIADNFMKPLKHAEDLDCYGATSDEIRRVSSEINGITLKGKAKDAAARVILDLEEFRLLSPDKADDALNAFKALDTNAKQAALKELKARALGFADNATFELIKKDIHAHVDDVIEACQKVKPGYYSKIDVHDNSTLNKIWGHLFGRKVEFSEMSNKLIGSKGMDNPYHRTALGKMFPKISNLMLEGMTNRVAGGKLIAIMQAWFVAEAIIRTAQAKGGDKLRTFTERLIELTGFFIFMPPAIQLMHKVGGMQYAGMSPEAVAKYREAVKAFNLKVESGVFAGNKAVYKAERKVLAESLNGGTKNIFAKLCKRVGRVVAVGLEQVRPYTKHAVEGGIKGKFKDFFRNPKYWLKQGAGYPVRIGLAMFMILPFFNKLGVKVSHAIFGKPSHSVLDDGKEKKPELTEAQQQEMLKMLEEAQKQQQAQQKGGQPFVSNNSSTNLLNKYKPAPIENKSPTNMLNMYKNGQAPAVAAVAGSQIPAQPQVQPQQAVQSQAQQPLNTVPAQAANAAPAQSAVQPAAAKKEEIKEPEPVRTYVPSPEPVKIVGAKAQDTSVADNAIRKSESIEKEAMQMLAGR